MGENRRNRYRRSAMNQMSSTDTSVFTSNRPSAESISRRAYELWEREGRPEGDDLRHWLQAEQELAGQAGGASSGAATSAGAAPSAPSDVRPLQGTRAASAAGRENNKRASRTPFSAEKSASATKAETAGARRRN